MGLAQPNIKNQMKLLKVIRSDQEYQTSKNISFQIIDIYEWSEWFQISCKLASE